MGNGHSTTTTTLSATPLSLRGFHTVLHPSHEWRFLQAPCSPRMMSRSNQQAEKQPKHNISTHGPTARRSEQRVVHARRPPGLDGVNNQNQSSMYDSLLTWTLQGLPAEGTVRRKPSETKGVHTRRSTSTNNEVQAKPSRGGLLHLSPVSAPSSHSLQGLPLVNSPPHGGRQSSAGHGLSLRLSWLRDGRNPRVFALGCMSAFLSP